jgi:hypothetical protein
MAETKTSQSKEHESPPPLRPDEVLRLNNVLKHNTSPKELQNLKSSNCFTLLDVTSDFKLEGGIHKIVLKNGMSAWNIDGKQRVIRGLPVQEFVRLKRSDIRVDGPTLPFAAATPPRVGRRDLPSKDGASVCTIDNAA